MDILLSVAPYLPAAVLDLALSTQKMLLALPFYSQVLIAILAIILIIVTGYGAYKAISYICTGSKQSCEKDSSLAFCINPFLLKKMDMDAVSVIAILMEGGDDTISSICGDNRKMLSYINHADNRDVLNEAARAKGREFKPLLSSKKEFADRDRKLVPLTIKKQKK